MRRPFLLALFSLLLSGHGFAAVAERNARYLVLEVDANDQVTLLESRIVRVASDVAPFDGVEPPLRGAPNEDAVEASLSGADGRTLAERVVVLDRFIRAEYTTSEDGTIDGRWIARDRTPFVVRLPAVDALFLDVSLLRSGRSRRFSVTEIDRRARAQSDSVAGARAAGTTSDATANAANRVDLLVVGDGYTVADEAKFHADVDRIAGRFLSVEPYASYRNYVSVSKLFVPSAQSGADHPKCAEGPPDPKAGTMVDTAFDATFCTSGIQRLLTVNSGKVYAAAAAVPDWDEIIVIVNDDMYGGAGGAISVSSTHASGVAILQHEYGHTFTRLADEYALAYPGYPPCSDRDPSRGCEANVTDETDRAAVKWGPWIEPSTPVPTPGHLTEVIGLFEGARYMTTGMYRPKHDCLMNHLDQPFCSVCAQAYVLRLHSGWNGVPARGVDLIEPGSEQPATPGVTARVGSAITFSAELLMPVGAKGLNVRWFVDGVEVSGAAANTFTFAPDRAATFVVELRVSHASPFVHPAMPPAALTKSRKWTVDAVSIPLPPKRRSVRP